MIAGGGSGVGAHAEALFPDVSFRIAANHIDQQQVLAVVLVINVTEVAAQIEAVEVEDAGDVTGANPEDRALRLLVRGLDVDVAVAALNLQQTLNVRKHITLGRIVGIGQVNLNLVPVLVGDGVKKRVAAPPPERRNDLVALLPQQVHDFQNIVAVEDAGSHAVSFSARTRTNLRSSPLASRICFSISRIKCGTKMVPVRTSEVILAVASAEELRARRRMCSPSRIPRALASSLLSSTNPSG